MDRRIRIIFLLAMLVLAAGGCKSIPEVRTAPLDPIPRLAILSAFEPEMEKLLEEAEITNTFVINGRTYYVGQLAGNNVAMTLSGISMVNAAMTTQTILNHFDITHIIFSGIAGGVSPDLSIGDIAVPARWGQYQEQFFARQTAQGWDAGQHSGEFGNFGMMFPERVSVARKSGTPDSEEAIFWFEVDPEMLAATGKAAVSVQLDKCTSRDDCLSVNPKVVVGGNGVSGPTFVDNGAYRQWVWETFEANVLDMETAAVAHVAYVNEIPFIGFRSLSDLAGGGPGKNELPIFFQLAADNSAAVVLAFLQEWAK